MTDAYGSDINLPGWADQSVWGTGTRESEEIAATAGDIFQRLAAHGHLHVHARHLTGNHVHDDPDLITAKFTGATTRAPRARWQITIDLWQSAAGHTNPSFTPLELALAAAHHTDHAHVLTRQPLERSPR